MPDEDQQPMPTFAITTLGCRANQSDSEAIVAALIARGLRPAGPAQPPDVTVVNTCTVTHLGDRSSRQAIAQGRRDAPAGLVVATGCYAQVAPQAVAAVPGVDLVVANRDKPELATLVAQRLGLSPDAGSLFPASEEHDRTLALLLGRTRAQIKVQDGCDNRCTYCIVPTARGASRSRPMQDIVTLVQRKAAAGIQEVVLTGIHLGDYHPTPGTDLGDLLAALLAETTIPRIRVSSLEPEDFQIAWLDLWQNPRLCRHLHLPLQSGSNDVLRRMARRYSVERYDEIAAAARQRIPGLALTTDIITGFPGETEADAAQTLAAVEGLAFAKLHVFRFSPRTGTAAARMRGTVADAAKRARAADLLEAGARLAHAFRERHMHQTVDVLWEGRRPWGWEGLTDHYLRVELRGDAIPGERNLHHTITPTTITAVTADGVLGSLDQKC